MKAFFALLVVLVSMPAFAAKPTNEQVAKFNDRMLPIYSAMDGVNGFGVGGCNADTGKPIDYQSNERDSSREEPCSTVYAETRKAEEALLVLFPPGSRIKNILIAVVYIGIVRPQ